jgi:hypothetical protein
MEKQDTTSWLCRYRLSKYRQDIESYGGREAEFHERFKPYEVIEGEGNCLLNSGINEMWDLICGEVSGSGHVFDNAHAQIGVGDSSTAAIPSQTDLQAASSKTYKGMESGYPTTTDQKITFKASFGDTEANHAWNEWVVRQATSEICLNRKVESLGTKASGTWTLEVSISLS